MKLEYLGGSLKEEAGAASWIGSCGCVEKRSNWKYQYINHLQNSCKMIADPYVKIT